MRTLEEIRTEMKATYINDSDVRQKYGITGEVTFDDTFSPISIETIWISVFSLIIYGVEFLFKQHMAEVENREDQMRVGTLHWWRNAVKSFQYGWGLEYDEDTNTYKYDEIDTEAQIIKFAEVRESELGLLVLINTDNGSGEPDKIPEGSPIRTAFANYLSKIKIAGIPVVWDSYNPDLLRIVLNVKYNPLVMDSEGKLIGTDDKPVNDALHSYLQSLVYGSGKANKTKMIDAIQGAEGIIDVWPDGINWLYISNDNEPAFTAIPGQDLLSYGGSFKFNSDDDIIINYIADV